MITFSIVLVQGAPMLVCTRCQAGYSPTVTGARMAFAHQGADNCSPAKG